MMQLLQDEAFRLLLATLLGAVISGIGNYVALRMSRKMNERKLKIEDAARKRELRISFLRDQQTILAELLVNGTLVASSDGVVATRTIINVKAILLSISPELSQEFIDEIDVPLAEAVDSAKKGDYDGREIAKLTMKYTEKAIKLLGDELKNLTT